MATDALGRSAHVKVTETPFQAPDWAYVEANPARLLDPDGWSTAPLHRVSEALGVMLALACEVVLPDCDKSEVRVKRIDLARDFSGVESAGFYLRGLHGLARPYSRMNQLFVDPTGHNAQTLVVGSNVGKVRLYDKFVETSGKAPAGTLRWEVQARGDWVVNAGLGTAGQLEPAVMESFAENRWEWSGMGTEVQAANRVIEAVQRSGLSPREQRSFIGWLVMKSNGFEQEISAETQARYNRLVRQLGITLGPKALQDTGAAITGRLDWESGTEVLRVG
jgi:hypothetical protein